jgi:hypothetical protein
MTWGCYLIWGCYKCVFVPFNEITSIMLKMNSLSCKMHVQAKLEKYQGSKLNWHFLPLASHILNLATFGCEQYLNYVQHQTYYHGYVLIFFHPCLHTKFFIWIHLLSTLPQCIRCMNCVIPCLIFNYWLGLMHNNQLELCAVQCPVEPRGTF